jgi:hypothetical protein
MKKEWLIRTKNNHILGPVSIKKVRELIENDSIKADDEISCGNGYWFYIREKELVEKYILSEKKQGFNPVTEAETVLAAPLKEEVEDIIIDENSGSAIPNNSDLEFPDLDSLTPTQEPIDELQDKEEILNELREKNSHEDESLSEEEISNNVLSIRKEPLKKTLQKPHIDPISKNKVKVEHLKQSRVRVQNSFFNQNVLYIISGLLFILALLGFYYRNSLMKEFIEARINIISPVYAQVIPNSVKKK